MNEKIRVPEVRVVDAEGTLLGVMATREAMTLALSQNLDLVEVAPESRPPVCRVMDYGRYKYEQSRKLRKARKKQQTTHLKEVRFRPKIDEHDYDFKIRHAREFLEKRDKVKVTVLFRGREIAYRDRGEKIMQRVEADLADVAMVEVRPRMEGRSLIQVMTPRPGAAPARRREEGEEKTGGPHPPGPRSPAAGAETPTESAPQNPSGGNEDA